MGRFKNKKVVVKTIGTDDWGMPTINGKKVATFRIPKKEELKEAASNAGMTAGDEPDTSFVADGQPRILNTAKPENWYTQGGYTQLHTPKADAMRGRGKSKDTETQFRKAYYKLKNVTQSTLNPADDPFKVEDWQETEPNKAIDKPKRFWEMPDNQKDTIISKEDIKEIVSDFDSILDEMGLGGGAGVGLSLPGGYINGAPKADDVKKVSKKLNNKGMSGYEEIDEDKIPGGLAKGKTIIDLAKKYDSNGYYDPTQFAKEYIKPKLMKGIKVEMEHTTDVRIATEIVMDHLWEDLEYYDKLAKMENPTNEGLKDLEKELVVLYNRAFKMMPMSPAQMKVRAEIDKLKKQIDSLKKESVNEAINPEVFREFMQACNDAGLNSFQIFGMHVLVYILTLGATGAAILSALGIAQLAKDAKDTFNNWNAGRKLNPQKVKEIVKDFENKVNKLEGGRKRFFQGIINKMKKANPKDKSSLVSINKDLKYYADRYNLDNESINESLLLEGGAYGHMNHPFDIEMNLTFGDLKQIVVRALNGDLELAREKTDGQALAVSWVNGRLVAARNKSHLKNKGAGAMTIGQVADKFAGRGGLTDAYNFAMQDLSKAIGALSEPQRKKVFKDGSSFMNLEVIYPTSVNVIPYNQPLLVFHGTFDYDMDGTIVGENQQAASILGGMIKQVNAHVQSKYTIQGPPINKLPKSEHLSKLQGKYLGMISKLQSEFGLHDSDGVADYHQAWWSKFVEKGGKKLDAQEKIGLVKRWAFGDKSFRIATIQNAKLRAWAEQTDKQDQQKISKQNLMRFEEIFLGVGADVLSFMESVLTANPDSAKRQMVSRLESTIQQVKASGDPKKIEKLKLELQRLNALGGFEKIVPNEGIVFVYGGNTYKLTGAFAPLNQILGIFFDS
jgi:hypothetical protein